jgi:hypothetical protein
MERRRSQVPAARVRKNLQVQKRSPAVPSLGDVFVMQLPTKTYLAGRVVLANGEPGRCPVPGAHLLYIYRKQLEAPKFDYSHMRPDQLVIASVSTAARTARSITMLGWPMAFTTMEGGFNL